MIGVVSIDVSQMSTRANVHLLVSIWIEKAE